MYAALPPDKPHCLSCTQEDFGSLEPADLQRRKDRPVLPINDTDETADKLSCAECGDDIETVLLLDVGKCPECKEPMVLNTLEAYYYLQAKIIGKVVILFPDKDNHWSGVEKATWSCMKCNTDYPCEMPVKFRVS